MLCAHPSSAERHLANRFFGRPSCYNHRAILRKKPIEPWSMRSNLVPSFTRAAILPRPPSWPRATSPQSLPGKCSLRVRSNHIRTVYTSVRPLPFGPPSDRNKLLKWSLLSIGGTSLLYLVLSADGSLQLATRPEPINNETNVKPITRPTHRKTSKSRSRALWNSIKRNIIEPVATASRFLYLLALFLPVLVTSPVVLLEYIELAHPRKRRKRRKDGTLITERASTSWWYKLLVSSTQKAGPTFIKLAQWAASRTDLFPAALCQHLGKLHSNGKPHSMAYTRRVLEKAFDKKFEDIFISFNPEPLGIGAVAQVYKATLKPDLLPVSYLEPKHLNKANKLSVAQLSRKLATSDVDPPMMKPSTTVAIKVLHPRVTKNIKRDLKIMGFFAYLVNCFPGAEWLSFPEEVEVFGKLMESQVNLKVEAQNLERFENNFTHRKTVSFPRPLNAYTTEKVLVEEFEDALPLKYFLRDSVGPFDHRISNIGLDAFLHMLLIDNFVHADLHPGNIMVKFYKPTTKSILQSLWRKFTNAPDIDAGHEDSQLTSDIVHRLKRVNREDPSSWNAELQRLDEEGFQPELVFIDSGLVNELDQKNQKNFLELFEAIAAFDGYKAGKLMVERCRTPELVDDEETFAVKIQHLASKVKAQTFSLSNIKVADVLLNVLTAVREHHVKMEADFVNTILSILILEGIGRQLNPNLDLFQSALPILRSLGSKQINSSGSSTRHFGSMFKIWLLLEARQFASIAVSEVDDMLKYDLLMPNI
ncbi:Atypical/ABC1/ABC1-C protein kinase [Puccinia triticina 1-1 BBBD Race 1]|uniref:ABC1 domain-containing protein n=2 Tax=Puccinia triticina TaxID=208348 RepID=A0A180GFR4_PUCT1|nr:Atypical/ABC1/ABC1-C protein kinase [Puccinia triticina 1-1 BBBD Race 1]